MLVIHLMLWPDFWVQKQPAQVRPQHRVELDLVLFDGAHKAVTGEHKSHAKSGQGVDKLVNKAELLRRRTKEGLGKYREFHNRIIRLAFLAESVAPSAEQSVEEACRNNGIAMLRRNGMAIGLRKLGMPPGRGMIRFT